MASLNTGIEPLQYSNANNKHVLPRAKCGKVTFIIFIRALSAST
jgi:hypothetical protein